MSTTQGDGDFRQVQKRFLELQAKVPHGKALDDRRALVSWMEESKSVHNELLALSRAAGPVSGFNVSPQKRQKGIRIQSLLDQWQSQHNAIDRALTRVCDTERDRKEREALLHSAHQRIAGPGTESQLNQSGGTGGAVEEEARREVVIQMNQSLTRSSNMADELYSHGADILRSLVDQRQRLKSTQRKLMDILHTLGLSQSLMRVIERRVSSDSLIMIAGMLLIGLLVIGLYYLWYW